MPAAGLSSFYRVVLPAGLWVALIAGTGVLTCGIIGFFVVQKYGKLGAVVRWAVAHRIGGAGLRKAALHTTEVDQKLRLLLPIASLRPAALGPVAHRGAYLEHPALPYYFLSFVTGGASMPLATAIVCLGIWFNLVTFALPVDFGVQETTRVIIFTILGFHSAVGLTYGITLRLEQLVWAGVGLAVYAILVGKMRERKKVVPGDGRGGDGPEGTGKQGGHMETHVRAFFVRRTRRLLVPAVVCIALVFSLSGVAWRAGGRMKKWCSALPEMIRMAIGVSPEMAERRSEAASAKSDLAQAQAGYYPQVDTTALVGPVNDARNGPRSSGSRIIDPSSNYWAIGVFGKLNLTMTQPLYTFGKISNRRDAAEHGVVGARGADRSRQATRSPCG